jgi:hypothetical protein
VTTPSPEPINLRRLITEAIEPTEPQDTILRILKEEFEGANISPSAARSREKISYL